MHSLTFSNAKKPFAEFHAEAVQAEQQAGGMVIHAQGEMVLQDVQVIENYLQPGASCHVRLTEGETELLSGQFEVAFFTFEANEIVVRLS